MTEIILATLGVATVLLFFLTIAYICRLFINEQRKLVEQVASAILAKASYEVKTSTTSDNENINDEIIDEASNLDDNSFFRYLEKLDKKHDNESNN